jgi:cyclopropane-fatty-acyl-phospholipid synthase
MNAYETASSRGVMLDATATPSVSRKLVETALDSIGVAINGPHPWDIQVYKEEFFDRALQGAGLGLGESYMDGWWDCEALDELVSRVLRSKVEEFVFGDWRLTLLAASAWFRNLQSMSRSSQVAETHYNLGNDVFEQMLGSTMMYSCAYWPTANTLDEAQEAKLDLICRKLDLQESDRVLDIGCGWGAFARYAARRFGCTIVGVTISQPQAEYAANLCAGLPVTILKEDYRSGELRRYGPFTKIVSIGMFEHVGRGNYGLFSEIAHKLLTPGGLFLLHTMGTYGSGRGDLWMRKYIFPNGELPFPQHIPKAAKGLFRIDDWHTFGPDYDRTLMAWWHNFENQIGSGGLFNDRRFCRMWRYYLLGFAGAFRSRVANELWQIVFSPVRSAREYRSAR